MEQFTLEKYLENPSRKICTREGKDVEIIYTNSPVPYHPIIGFIDKSIYTWTIDGKLIYGKEEQDKNDLFFADEEEELTEFEKEVNAIIDENIKRNIGLKYEARNLLNLARKELEKEYHIVYKDDNNWEDGYEQGKQDALKGLPKLEKTEGVVDPTIPVMYTNAASMKTYVEYNGYKVCINDAFENLPKEE